MTYYSDELEKHDEKLLSRGYSADVVEDAHKKLHLYRNRPLECVVGNIGNVSPIFENDTVSECARVLLLYALGASDHFEEPSE